MNFQSIKKYLGNAWLQKELESINKKEWVNDNILKEKISNEPAFFMLSKVNDLIKKFEKIGGFSQWIKEAQNSGKSFKCFLFELMVLENLLLKSDKLILKPHNSKTNKDPDALIEKRGNSFYIEMTFLESLPKSVNNLVIKLFHKSTKKFGGSQGIHFIGTFGFFRYEGDVRKPLSEFGMLNKLIELRYKRFGTSTIAFIPTEITIRYNPNLQKSFIHKFFYLNAKPLEQGGLPNEFFEEIFDVNEFRII